MKPKQTETLDLAVQEPTAVAVPLEARREPSTLELFASLARDTSIPLERIEQLMKLKMQSEAEAAKQAYISAMTRLSKRLPRVVKRGKIPKNSGAIPFATFEDIDAVCRPLLAEEGLMASFTSEATETGVLVVCTIRHELGHSESSRMNLPPDAGPGRNKLQELGSSLSYARRYLYNGLLNIVTVGEDDDSMSMSAITEDQQRNIECLMDECRLTPEAKSKFLDTMGVKSIGDIQQGGYKAAINLLIAKRRTVEEKQQ